jgi:hypothetical protein
VQFLDSPAVLVPVHHGEGLSPGTHRMSGQQEPLKLVGRASDFTYEDGVELDDEAGAGCSCQ